MGWLGQRSREMARDIWLVLRVRSFQLIVLQVSVTSACVALSQAQCIAWGTGQVLLHPGQARISSACSISFFDGQAL